MSQYGKQGIPMLCPADAAESIGLKPVGAKLTDEQLINDVTLLVIFWVCTFYAFKNEK